METYIRNIVDRKHQNRLETKFLDWKHVYEIRNKKKYIGNNIFRLETKFVDWKHDYEIGNKKSTLETIYLDWKHKSLIGNMFPFYVSNLHITSTYDL